MEDRQVSLKQVLDTVDEMPVMKDNNGMEFVEKSLAKTRIGTLQPELNEWCTDCKEYDQERHCCPRFNKVIRKTVEEYKAEHPEPCEDAVSREDVINFLCDWICAPGVRCNESSDKCGCIRGIKALPSAQPEKRTEERTEMHGVCLDVIDRQAAIDVIFSEPLYESGMKKRDADAVVPAIYEKIKSLPSAQPEIIGMLNSLPSVRVQPDQRWIPVTERLPEYMEPVLTWDGSTYCVEKRIPIVRDNDAEEGIPGDWWVSDDYDEYDSDYYPNLRDGACIAWMPLPEPWAEMD